MHGYALKYTEHQATVFISTLWNKFVYKLFITIINYTIILHILVVIDRLLKNFRDISYKPSDQFNLAYRNMFIYIQ